MVHKNVRHWPIDMVNGDIGESAYETCISNCAPKRFHDYVKYVEVNIISEADSTAMVFFCRKESYFHPIKTYFCYEKLSAPPIFNTIKLINSAILIFGQKRCRASVGLRARHILKDMVS